MRFILRWAFYFVCFLFILGAARHFGLVNLKKGSFLERSVSSVERGVKALYRSIFPGAKEISIEEDSHGEVGLVFNDADGDIVCPVTDDGFAVPDSSMISGFTEEDQKKIADLLLTHPKLKDRAQIFQFGPPGSQQFEDFWRSIPRWKDDGFIRGGGISGGFSGGG